MSIRSSSSPGPPVPNPEILILPNDPVGERAAELLGEFIHASQHDEFDVDADYYLRRAYHKDLPWYKTPSPWWLLIIVPFTAIAMSATLAPRIEVFTLIVCSVLKPGKFPLPTRGHASFGAISRGLVSNTSFYNGLEGGSCAADPAVQAEVAKLAAVSTTSMGILSCVTAGWWGSYSDRHGRTRLFSISVIGLLFTDLNFILTAKNFQYIPGGYWFVILGPIIEGLLGGVTATYAAMHAYVADTTTESSRSRTLSLALGLIFTGMAIGPSLGSVLVRFTGNPLSVFYAAFGVHLIYAFIVSFIVPESLLRSQMEQSRLKHNIQLREAAENMAAGAYMRIKRLFAFLSPLKVFLPGFQETIPVVNTSKEGRDWNLTILAGVYALEISIIGSYTTQFQFAAATYGWTSETLGYFLTLVGATRALFLAVILPCFIKFLKPRPRNIKNPEAERLLPGPSQKVLNKVPHSTAFDLGLARVSLFVEAVSYTLMALAPTELAFTGFSVMASLGAGLNPALQSVSLALYRRRGGTESGRLFGALSVLQALSSQLVSPAMYGLVYTKTVATFPRAIFILLMTTIVCSFVLLTSVRLPKPDVARASSNHVEGQSRPTASAPRS